MLEVYSKRNILKFEKRGVLGTVFASIRQLTQEQGYHISGLRKAGLSVHKSIEYLAATILLLVKNYLEIEAMPIIVPQNHT